MTHNILEERSQSAGLELDHQAAETQFVVEAIQDHKKEKSCPIDRSAGLYKLFIKWQNYTPSEDTWEPLENMQHDIPHMVDDYFKAKKITVIPMPYKGTLYHKLEKSGGSSTIKSKTSSVTSPKAKKNNNINIDQQPLAFEQSSFSN